MPFVFIVLVAELSLGRILGQMEDEVQDEETSDDFEVPEEVETVLEHLFESLKDKVTFRRSDLAETLTLCKEYHRSLDGSQRSGPDIGATTN